MAKKRHKYARVKYKWLYTHAAEVECDDLRDFVYTMSSGIAGEVKKFESLIDRITAGMDVDRANDVAQQYDEEAFGVYDRYPRLLWQSSFISLYAFFEEEMNGRSLETHGGDHQAELEERRCPGRAQSQTVTATAFSLHATGGRSNDRPSVLNGGRSGGGHGQGAAPTHPRKGASGLSPATNLADVEFPFLVTERHGEVREESDLTQDRAAPCGIREDDGSRPAVLSDLEGDFGQKSLQFVPSRADDRHQLSAVR